MDLIRQALMKANKLLVTFTLLLLGFNFAWSVEIAQQAEAIQANVDGNTSSPSKIFGSWMFKGDFANESFSGFNPNYEMGVGNRINIQIWGGYEYQGVLEVDAQGNVFVPKVGPVAVLGIRNSELNTRMAAHIKTVYSKNVSVYTALETAQPVKVYVTGFVPKPGLYAGLASDSILFYLDKAGGITPHSGSYIDVTVLRNNEIYKKINLYDFLLRGVLAPLQLSDGDTIWINHRLNFVSVSGIVQNPYEFEFSDAQKSLEQLLNIAKVGPTATHVRITRNKNLQLSAEYYPLSNIAGIQVSGGDQIEVTADNKLVSISVRVEGEHDSPQEYVLAYGTRLGELMDRIEWNQRSDTESIQIFRKSLKQRQKQMLQSSLQALEFSLLTARSATTEEAKLRTQEAELALQWVARAQSIEPQGQLVLAGAESVRNILLEPGDIVRVPRKTNLILVHGEVLAPNAVAYSSNKKIEDYIAQAGGFTQDDGNNKILLLHRNGSFTKVALKHIDNLSPSRGDEIMILPKIDTKSLQVSKDITQIMYQIAVSAGVILAI